MVTIPELTIKVAKYDITLPALDVDNPEELLRALEHPDFNTHLDAFGYICLALDNLGVDAKYIERALSKNYDVARTVEALICVQTDRNVDIRQHGLPTKLAWCDHMRTHLKQALS